MLFPELRCFSSDPSQVHNHVQRMIEISNQCLIRPRHLNVHPVRTLLKYYLHHHPHPVHQHASIRHQLIPPILLPEHLAQVVVLQLPHKRLQIIRILQHLLLLYALLRRQYLLVLLDCYRIIRDHHHWETQWHLENKHIVDHSQSTVNTVWPAFQFAWIVLCWKWQLDFSCLAVVYLDDLADVNRSVVELESISVEFEGKILN